MSALKLFTATTQEPVSLIEAKLWLRIDEAYVRRGDARSEE